jgi:hypothetical protein
MTIITVSSSRMSYLHCSQIHEKYWNLTALTISWGISISDAYHKHQIDHQKECIPERVSQRVEHKHHRVNNVLLLDVVEIQTQIQMKNPLNFENVVFLLNTVIPV